MPGQIVVIEDEPSVQELLRDILEPQGYAVVSFDHPRALELDPNQDVDLILMDLMLPAQSGVQLAGKLRAAGFRHTPIIAMSASRIMLHVAAESGFFQETVSKPFDVGDLLRCVRQYAGRYVL